MSDSKKFYGKYRGTVLQNQDPQQIGRIQVIVPDVSALLPTSWAMPCVPIAGKQAGSYFVPQIGSGVWVEFEQGDPDYPIWVGCYWGVMAEVPPAALVPPPIPPESPVPAPATPGTGGIILRSPTGSMIVVNDSGIFINNGKGASIEMVGPSVMINKVALVVT
jgi:uncharacterized protein involved in type VI secretion and phage assembly